MINQLSETKIVSLLHFWQLLCLSSKNIYDVLELHDHKQKLVNTEAERAQFLFHNRYLHCLLTQPPGQQGTLPENS